LYIGYDPSASSLHAGSLLTVMALVHLQRHGHRPIILVGGGTGMIGDPSGRTEMRRVMTPEEVERNVDTIRQQFAPFIDFGPGKAQVVNNAEWLMPLRFIDFMRDIGVRFTVSHMLATEAYKARLDVGLTFSEFSYQLLQAYDFLHLYRTERCLLQVGGNDQWGNILAGADLIRRVESRDAYALCFPLLTTSTGEKMGKSMKGAIWLDATLMAPYDFYQFWINTTDADVVRFLKIYTFLPMERIAELGRLEGADLRQAKQVLAHEVTTFVHGRQAADAAREASERIFGGREATDAIPTTSIPRVELVAGIDVAELFCRVGLTATRAAARRLIQQGGAYINDAAVASADQQVTLAHAGPGGLLLRYGKKRYHRVVVSD
jgi:tyrosyl-tRNA synthetase